MTTYEVTSLCSLSDLSSSISSCSSSRTFVEAVALGVSMACRRNSTAHATVTRKFPLTPLGCVSLHHSCCASTVNAYNKPKTCLNLDCCYETLAEVEIRGKRNSISCSIAYVATCNRLPSNAVYAYSCRFVAAAVHTVHYWSLCIASMFPSSSHPSRNTPRPATTALVAWGEPQPARHWSKCRTEQRKTGR